MEIVAKRNNRLIFAYLFIVLIGVGAIAAIFLIPTKKWLMVILGIFLIVVGLGCMFSLLKTPNVIAATDGQFLYIKGNQIKPEDIVALDYKVWGGRWGQLFITLQNTELKIQFAQNVSQAFDAIEKFSGKNFFKDICTPDEPMTDNSFADQNTETIARRRDETLSNAICFILFGGIILVSLICAIIGRSTDNEEMYVISLIVLLSFVIVGVGFLFAFLRYIGVPERIIVKEGNVLHFKKFSCDIGDIQSVTYKEKRGRNGLLGYGNLYLYIGGKKYTFIYVDNIEKTAKKLQRLMNENKI